VNIRKQEQFRPEFLAISPNNKIPAIIDQDGPGGQPLSIFESGAILIYLAEKSGRFLATAGAARFKALEWLFLQVGGIGPAFGTAHHFRSHESESTGYAAERATKEAARVMRVLETRLGEVEFLGGEYSIADIATFPWLETVDRQGLRLPDYPHVERWFRAVAARPADQRSR
jgi:GST-like protein